MKVHVLIWGDLIDRRWMSTASLPAMAGVIDQKSADGILTRSHRYVNPGEGLNISQEGACSASGIAQHVINVKLSSGGREQKPVLNENLLERVLSPENLHTAWRQVKRNKGAPGVDGITIEDYPQWARKHWAAIRRALEGGYYIPQPVRRVEIPKPNGGIRLLGIPTVNDRVIQQAIAQVLNPIIDPTFSESSHGFRPGRNAHGAVRQIKGFIKEGYRAAVDVDLSKFFDRVNHDILMSRMTRFTTDKRLLKLIGRYLRAGVEIDGLRHPTPEGVPQGGLCKALHNPPYA